MGPKRIYIGGLTADIQDSDIAGRFKPFGDVLSTEVIKAKAVGADPASCRGFAYVTFDPKDDASLARMLSLYNGCKWRGQKLRVELGKPDFATRLRAEWQADEEQEQEQASHEHSEQQAQQALQPTSAEPDGHLLKLTAPGPKKKILTVDLTTKAKSHRSWFPTHKMKRPHELDWEPLPPSKRAALQAAAEAAMPATRAPPAHLQVLEQLRDEAVVQHVPHDQQQQQLPQQAVNGLQARGAAVPFSHQQQQQQKAVTAATAKKGSSKVVQQELMGQLKLLKRIAERDQQQQPHQRGSRSSKAVVDFPDDPGSLHQQLVSMKAFDAAAAGPGAGPGAGAAAGGLDVLLSRFDDSDSNGDSDGGGDGRTQQQDGLLVAAVPVSQPAAASAATAVLHHSKQHQQQQLVEKGAKQGQPQPQQEQHPPRNKPQKHHQQEVAEQPVMPNAVKHQQQQQQQLRILGKLAQPLQRQRDAGATDLSSSDPDGSDAGADSDYGSDQWEQWLAAEGITNTADEEPGAAATRNAAGQTHGGHAGAKHAPGAAETGAASPYHSREASSGDTDEAGEGPSGLPDWGNEGAGGADGVDSSDGTPSAATTSDSGSDKDPDMQPEVQGEQQDWAASRAAQQHVGKVQRPLPVQPAKQAVEAAAKQRKPAAGAAVLGWNSLDRFGSDSEEVLVDVDDEEVEAASTAAVQGKRRLQRADMLLCPKPRTKAGR